MARKISVEAADALMEGREYKNSNTEVVQIGDTAFLLVLHGNEIAEYDVADGFLYVSDGGYTPMSSTTKERLNALPGVKLHTSKKQLILNGKKWNGESVLVVYRGQPYNFGWHEWKEDK